MYPSLARHRITTPDSRKCPDLLTSDRHPTHQTYAGQTRKRGSRTPRFCHSVSLFPIEWEASTGGEGGNAALVFLAMYSIGSRSPMDLEAERGACTVWMGYLGTSCSSFKWWRCWRTDRTRAVDMRISVFWRLQQRTEVDTNALSVQYS